MLTISRLQTHDDPAIAMLETIGALQKFLVRFVCMLGYCLQVIFESSSSSEPDRSSTPLDATQPPITTMDASNCVLLPFHSWLVYDRYGGNNQIPSRPPLLIVA